MREHTKDMSPEELLAHRKACASAQASFCERERLPHFAPKDGVCWRCHGNLFDLMTVEQAGSSLITGCRICNRTYVD